MALIIIRYHHISIIEVSPLAPHRVRFAPQNRLFGSADCMHWLNVRFLNRLRQPAALISLAVELAAIAAFTLMFREVGTERQ